MPGMKLDFLKNPHQRVATGKSLPLKQIEAIILYGRPEQRAKVVEKLTHSAYGLSLNKTTHHVLLSLLDHADNMARVNMVYSVRSKILDLSISPVGNVVLQKMIDKVPSRQRREIAQAFILNVEPDEYRRLCEHPFGNHVAQKFMEYPECAEVVCPEGLVPYLADLAVHAYGMRVVAKYIESVRGGWKRALRALFPGTPLDAAAEGDDGADDLPDTAAFLEGDASAAIDNGVERLFKAHSESMVLCALLRSLMVPNAFKDAIVAHLSEYVADYLNPQPPKPSLDEEEKKKKPESDGDFAMPDFGSATVANGGGGSSSSDALAPKHVHVFCAVFEQGDESQREDLWNAIASGHDLVDRIVSTRAVSPVAVAAAKHFEGSRADLYAALFRGPGSGKQRSLGVCDVAEDPVRTMLLRAFVEAGCASFTEAQRTEMRKEAVRLAQSPSASPVLQKLLEADGSRETAAAMYKAVHEHLSELATHPSGCYFVQALLHFSDEAQREQLSERLWAILGDNLQETLSYTHGSHVVQKLLLYASDDVVGTVVERLVEDARAEAEAAAHSDTDTEEAADEEEDEGGEEREDGKEGRRTALSRKEQIAINRKRHYGVRSHAVVDYALHNCACYVIQVLLRETRSRQLDKHRKMLMDELKPHVFELAVSPWAGRVVLEAMMQVGSAQLADAMKNVVFLKAETWLSEVSDSRKQRGAGMDATMRATLKRQRELNGSGNSGSAQQQQQQQRKSKGGDANGRLHKKVKG